MIQRRPVVLKNLEEVLVSAKLFGTILGNTGVVLTMIDSDFNLIYVNYKGESIFQELHEQGYDFLGKKCYEAFRKGTRPCPGCKTAGTIETQRPARAFVAHNKLVDRVFSISAYPINDLIEDKVKTIAVIEVAQDITAQHLAAGRAHDANNLLTNVVGPLSTAQYNHERGEIDMPGLVEQITIASKSAQKVGDLMTDLQNILSGKFGWEHYTRAPLDLKKILEDTAELFRGRYEEVGVDLVLECQDVPTISGHRQGMESVFENLLWNALDALRERKEEQPLLVARMYHAAGPHGGYIHAEFEDNGPGIKSEDINHIFDLYFTTKEQGHGLGLANSRRIVEKRHFGAMRVSSKYGKGAKFEVLIPDPTRLKYLQKEK